jgi:hypothetical protein
LVARPVADCGGRPGARLPIPPPLLRSGVDSDGRLCGPSEGHSEADAEGRPRPPFFPRRRPLPRPRVAYFSLLPPCSSYPSPPLSFSIYLNLRPSFPSPTSIFLCSPGTCPLPPHRTLDVCAGLGEGGEAGGNLRLGRGAVTRGRDRPVTGRDRALRSIASQDIWPGRGGRAAN